MRMRENGSCSQSLLCDTDQCQIVDDRLAALSVWLLIAQYYNFDRQRLPLLASMLNITMSEDEMLTIYATTAQ